MDVHKTYTNTVNRIASGLLLSDTVVTKMPIISCFADSHKTYIVYSFAKTVRGRVFALGWLTPRINGAENVPNTLLRKKR